MYKVYVQDILQSKLETKVYNLVHKEEGHLYVCGDVRMARDVAQTLKGMFAKKLNLSEQQAEEYFFQLKVRGALFPSAGAPGRVTRVFKSLWAAVSFCSAERMREKL